MNAPYPLNTLYCINCPNSRLTNLSCHLCPIFLRPREEIPLRMRFRPKKKCPTTIFLTIFSSSRYLLSVWYWNCSINSGPSNCEPFNNTWNTYRGVLICCNFDFRTTTRMKRKIFRLIPIKLSPGQTSASNLGFLRSSTLLLT